MTQTTKIVGFRISKESHTKYLALNPLERKTLQVDLSRYFERKLKSIVNISDYIKNANNQQKTRK